MTPPSRTAILITASATASSRLVYGRALEHRAHPRGSVVLLPSGEIVYEFRARKVRAFVFRTLAAPECLSSAVPGVSPHVRLLLHTHTRGRLRRLEELLRHLARIDRHPSSLSDAFYTRLHAVLSGRLPRGKILRALLDQEEPRAACV